MRPDRANRSPCLEMVILRSRLEVPMGSDSGRERGETMDLVH